MKYKLIIFDFDGTLADTFPWMVSFGNKVADKYKFKKVPETEIDYLRGLGAREIFKYLDIPVWKAPVIAKYALGLLSENIDKISLFDGIDDLLRRISNRGATIAILSTNSFANITTVLGPENTALIDQFECGASIFGKRPKLRKILKKSGIPASEAIYIGDEIRDCEAATKEGVAFGAVSWGYTRVEALEACHPAEVFTSVDQIVEKVLVNN